MTILRVGSNKRYADNWDAAFGAGKGTKKTASPKKAKSAQVSPKKKKAATPKKAAAKKKKASKKTRKS